MTVQANDALALKRAKQAERQRAYWARLTPEQRAEVNARRRNFNQTPEGKARKRRWNAKHKENVKADPARLAKAREYEAARQRRRWAAMPIEKRRELYRRQWERQKARRPSVSAAPLAGSVLAAAAPGEWRDLLAQLTALAPRSDEREDIIAEAAMLVIEGASPADAIRQARRTVNREAAPARYAKPLHDCHWL